MKLVDMTVSEFVDLMASDAPAPGGGSASALNGALGAGLAAMVCALTIGKKKYAECEADARAAQPGDLIHSPCGRIARFEMPPHRASATTVRRTMSAYPFAEAMRRLDGWLPVGVAQYIRAHRLYCRQ